MAIPTVAPKVDPITLMVVRNHLSSYADEMANTVIRTAYSTVVRDCMDFSTALCNARGEMIAQGVTIPLHLGSIPFALGSVIRKYQGRICPGDVFILNDPFEGGIHLPDIFLFKPVFHSGELLGFSAVISHHVDVGGRVAGGACDNTEIFHDGLRIPPLKFFDRGEPNEALFAIIEKNVRVPKLVLGDIQANLAALRTGESGLLELAGRHGNAELSLYFDELLNYTEKLMRAEIRAWKDGDYEFTDYLDDDGVDPSPIPIRARISIRGDTLSVDFEGTSPQVRGAINSPLSFTMSAVAYAVRSIMGVDIPNTSGIFRPLQVNAPEGSILNPVMPAASTMRGITGFRVADALFGSLARAVPERVPAAGEGGNSIVVISGYHENREPFVVFDLVVGNWGARPVKDGIDGITNPGSVVSNIPAELMELEYPVRVEQYGLVEDTGGAGKYRGGLAVVRDWRFLGKEAGVSTRSDRRKHPPYGLQGGLPGAPSIFLLNPDKEAAVLGTKETFRIRHGDLIRHVTAGGGGWGDPLQRDPERVLADVLNFKVSLRAAREQYGVVIDPDSLQLDWKATETLRKER